MLQWPKERGRRCKIHIALWSTYHFNFIAIVVKIENSMFSVVGSRYGSGRMKQIMMIFSLVGKRIKWTKHDKSYHAQLIQNNSSAITSWGSLNSYAQCVTYVHKSGSINFWIFNWELSFLMKIYSGEFHDASFILNHIKNKESTMRTQSNIKTCNSNICPVSYLKCCADFQWKTCGINFWKTCKSRIKW